MNPPQRILFITGRLAEAAVRRVVAGLSERIGFDYEVRVLGISVAALMHVDWLRRRLYTNLPDVGTDKPQLLSSEDNQLFDRVLLPGWVQGDVPSLSEDFGVPFELGPKDVFDLPEYFGRGTREPVDLSRYDIDILAEINHAPRMSDTAIIELAARYRNDGADIIDIGCIPGERWSRVDKVVSQLVAAGHRVSIDSFDRHEVEAAVVAGAELILSCNNSNREWIAELPVESVVIPDDPAELVGLDETAIFLSERDCKYRLDAILEPVGYSFTASLLRYAEVRKRYPQQPIMMGIGNVTEMSEVDSAGIQFLLAAICQELSIHSVLTTEVAPWCRTAVQEFDLARRLAKHAVDQRALAKHVDSSLLMLRDPKVTELGEADLREIATQLTDPNFRIFVDGGQLHIMNRAGHWHGTDPFELFDHIAGQSDSPDPSHAFYLGYELAKAVTALTLDKQYRQDQPLNWGFLTREEISPHERRRQSGGDSTPS